MRFDFILLAGTLAWGPAALGQTDPRIALALPEIARQASRFWQTAPQFVARETLKQKAVAPSHKKLRIGQTALEPRTPVFKVREIISLYGFSSFASTPEALHEIRRIVSVDEKPVEDSGVARDHFKSVAESRDDGRKRALLKDFERSNLSSAAIDFGQLILLFTRAKLDRYSFELRNPSMVGADQALVISFHQNNGDASLRITEAGQKIRRPLEGELWVRAGDFQVLRITVTAVRPDGKAEIRDEARVDYAPNPTSAVLPASMIYRRFLNDQLFAENICQYSDWQPLETR